MAYASTEILRAALEALKEHKGPPVVGWSLLVMLCEGIPITDDATEAKRFGGPQETAFLDEHFRLGVDPARPYFNPFQASFVEPHYASRSLQARRTDLKLSGVLLHPSTTRWGIKSDFADRLLSADLKDNGSVPFWALALWMLRSQNIENLQDSVDEIWTKCNMNVSPDVARIFDRIVPESVAAMSLAPAVLSDTDLLLLARGGSAPARDFAQVVDSFAVALRASNVDFGANHTKLVASFAASLATKRFVILTGLSGSGKTQLALRFGEWLGAKRSLVVPVRPDWSGADALFGYEDALQPMDQHGRRAWNVPEVLAFMLRAASDKAHPYLLLLDEMNLAHVERYFADVLSGMESGEPTVPNLARDVSGTWRANDQIPRVPIPANLFVVGTVNIDETTYMFSPKVLDRASTFEFRVRTDDLNATARRPIQIEPASEEDASTFLEVATDEGWQELSPAKSAAFIADELRRIHAILSIDGFEFGHRVFYEALRFAAIYEATGVDDKNEVLDAIVMQKLLPRLHGTRRRLEPVLSALGQFCAIETNDATSAFDPLALLHEPRLPVSFEKIRRMTRGVRLHQFASFTE